MCYYKQFLYFVVKKRKLRFEIVKFLVQSFLRKHNLSKKTIECYLLFDGESDYCRRIAEKLNISHSTVWWHLQKLQLACPELFIKKLKIPSLNQMLHLPDEDNVKNQTFFEYFGKIKEKF